MKTNKQKQTDDSIKYVTNNLNLKRLCLNDKVLIVKVCTFLDTLNKYTRSSQFENRDLNEIKIWFSNCLLSNKNRTLISLDDRILFDFLSTNFNTHNLKNK